MLRGRDGKGDIAALVFAGEGRVDRERLAAEGEGVAVAPEGGFLISCGGKSRERLWGVGDEGCGADGVDVEGTRGFADDLVGLGVLREGDEGAAGAEDATLFAGDVGDGGAEIVGVVDRDVGEDGKDGVDDVGGVEAATETDLKDGDLGVMFSDMEEGDGSEGLKEAGRVRELAGGDEALGGVIDEEVEAGEVVVGDFGEGVIWPAELDALVDAAQVRGGIERGAVAGGGEDAGEGSGGGAFAVGAGDQDAGEAVLRVAESGAEGAHVGEVEFAARWGQLADAIGRRKYGLALDEFLAEGVEAVNRGGVGHRDIVGDGERRLLGGNRRARGVWGSGPHFPGVSCFPPEVQVNRCSYREAARARRRSCAGGMPGAGAEGVIEAAGGAGEVATRVSASSSQGIR